MDKIKKNAVFFVYAALIILIPAYIVGSSENILANGKLYKFRMEGRDPFDFLRGNYLTVRLDTRNIPTEKSDWKAGEEVYLRIAEDEEGFAYFDKALKEPPKKGDYMVSRVVRWWDSRSSSRGFSLFGRRSRKEPVTVSAEMPNNLNKYFVNEDHALDGEYLLNSNRNRSYVGVRVKNGNVRLQDIYIGEVKIQDILSDKVDVPEDNGENLLELMDFR
jgi:uncharacterized membrane-anchored protein